MTLFDYGKPPHLSLCATRLNEKVSAVMKDNSSVDETRLIQRLIWRIMPLIVVCFLAAIIDRSNVGFAKLQMVGDLKLTEVAYGFGAALFFFFLYGFHFFLTLFVFLY